MNFIELDVFTAVPFDCAYEVLLGIAPNNLRLTLVAAAAAAAAVVALCSEYAL